MRGAPAVALAALAGLTLAGPCRATAEAARGQQAGPREPVRETVSCVVSGIVDGDTIECSGLGRVRLIGVDTPELSQAPYGSQAAAALAGLIPVGSLVELEFDVERRDRFSRLLAYVWKSGLQVNWWLVRRGWAVVTTYPPNVAYVSWYTAAQRSARAEAAGLWAWDAFDCLPQGRRLGQCEE